jgi:hypothetical protein
MTVPNLHTICSISTKYVNIGRSRDNTFDCLWTKWHFGLWMRWKAWQWWCILVKMLLITYLLSKLVQDGNIGWFSFHFQPVTAIRRCSKQKNRECKSLDFFSYTSLAKVFRPNSRILFFLIKSKQCISFYTCNNLSHPRVLRFTLLIVHVRGTFVR